MSDTGPASLYELLRGIRYETTAIQAKVSDAMKLLATLKLEDVSRPKCERCGASFAGSLSLSEHLYLAHDGPEPVHWLEAEARTGEARS
jgi:hypothetical protein